ncbi:MAG: trimeric intracellular cation channel family protein [Bacteroidaceae bacterium]|nr:trimeric intracellular cation channel family protein [Bacteroidaceae bacterium]
MDTINEIIRWGAAITFIDIIDFIGTFAFAISGIRLASTKQFDWFGAYVVGAATAIGGGTIRDIMLDVPLFWMHDPFYLICTGLALLWVIIFRKYLIRMHYTFFVFDAVGLALFTVVGIQKTIECGLPLWVGIIMGTMTGAAGGVIRDVLINEVPLIFRKEIYAMACIIGGVVFTVCTLIGLPPLFTHLACGAAVFITRVVAVKYHICLPTLRSEED